MLYLSLHYVYFLCSVPSSGLLVSDLDGCVAVAQLVQLVCTTPIMLTHTATLAVTVQEHIQQVLESIISGK